MKQVIFANGVANIRLIAETGADGKHGGGIACEVAIDRAL